MPGTGVPEFDRAFHNLCKHHHSIHRVQVSHTEMRDLVLSSGIDSSKVFLIPIGINLDFFGVQTPQSRYLVRERLGISQSAVVIGSFQKDGVGWADGNEPKLIKGPDVFLKVIERLKAQIPELFVLLSGPARGYVKSGLERLGIPYRHVFLKSYPEIAGLYSTLDLYLVTSRQEGGPKAVLESMASGISLVTTCVGQAMDLVKHGHNGWMVDVEDVEGLVYWASYVIQHPVAIAPVLVNARKTAESNSYASQQPLWQNLLTGFVAP
jgi:glycosyltransferase involved in cell wall biosynthesis